MVVTKHYQFLQFHIKILNWFRLWARDGETQQFCLRNFALFATLLPLNCALTVESVLSVYEQDGDVDVIIQPVLALICSIAEQYLIFCFLFKKYSIKKLVNSLETLNKFTDLKGMIETDKKVILLTKALLVYSTIGSFAYCLAPLLSIPYCEANVRTKTMIEKGIPCGMVCRIRLPFKHDYSPLMEIFYLQQVYFVFTITWLVIVLTMLQCAFVIHATYHMKILRKMLLNLGEYHRAKITYRLKFCIKYHNEIIKICDDMNDCFSSQMIVHISITSLIMSILCFELMSTDIYDSIRYVMHLCGWICLLFLVCHYGQTLINESTEIGTDCYNTDWNNFPIDVQKDIILLIARTQKPIYLKTLNIGYLSYTTFMKVMQATYSYMTLFFNTKK